MKNEDELEAAGVNKDRRSKNHKDRNVTIEKSWNKTNEEVRPFPRTRTEKKKKKISKKQDWRKNWCDVPSLHRRQTTREHLLPNFSANKPDVVARKQLPL